MKLTSIAAFTFFLVATLTTVDAFGEEEIKLEYRGGNGTYSPDFKYYVGLQDSWNYLHFSLFALTESETKNELERVFTENRPSTFKTEKRTPIAVLKIPFENVNVRSMKLHWHNKGTIFTAIQSTPIRETELTYDITSHELELKKKR